MGEMRPEDVPDELVRVVLAAHCTTCLQTVGRTPYSDHEEEARQMLAAVLPLHERQLRERIAAELELAEEWGVRSLGSNSVDGGYDEAGARKSATRYSRLRLPGAKGPAATYEAVRRYSTGWKSVVEDGSKEAGDD